MRAKYSSATFPVGDLKSMAAKRTRARAIVYKLDRRRHRPLNLLSTTRNREGYAAMAEGKVIEQSV